MRSSVEKLGSLHTPKSFRACGSKIYNSVKSKNKNELYDKLLMQKQEIHSIKEQNLLLKSKIRQQQQNKSKKGNIIKELEMRIKNPKTKGYLTKSNPHLVNSLKLKKIEVRGENLKLRKELKKVQKCTKYTLMNELKGEKKAYNNELQRLYRLTESVEKANSLIPIEDAEVIKANILEQDEILENLRKEQRTLLKELNEKESEISKYKKFVEGEPNYENKEKEIRKLKEEIDSLKKVQGCPQ